MDLWHLTLLSGREPQFLWPHRDRPRVCWCCCGSIWL